MKGNFKEVIAAGPVLVDFHTTWCGPCKAQEPIIKEFASAMGNKVRVIKIDVDKNPGIASRYGVRGVPTIAFFNEGTLCYRHSGVHTLAQLKQLVAENSTQKEF